jgi:hypothetical protein
VLRAVPLLALLLLAGCARPVGDLGRAERGVLHDEIMPAIGHARATQSGEASSFNLTDQEVEMRDRVWRYLVSPHAYDWFGDIAVEYQRTRIVPIGNKRLPTNTYYEWLHSSRFASSRVRYSRVDDDAIADIGMMPSAFRSICAVIEIDRQRGIASNEIEGLEDDVSHNAAARHAENLAVIGWFVRAVGNRYQSYSYALDHLLVETPHEEAVDVNASLSQLAIYVDAAERGDFCSDLRGGKGGVSLEIPSRVLRTTPGEGPYRK